jgi:hypothetical protein
MHLLEKVTILTNSTDSLDDNPFIALAVIAQTVTRSSKQYSCFNNQDK